MNSTYLFFCFHPIIRKDVVPALSGPTFVNAIRNVMEFDWLPYADRDTHEAILAFHASHPNLFGKERLLKVQQVITSYLEDYASRKVQAKTDKRYSPVLFPPGRCIHFYRDGVGYSANIVPNTFFSEIHISRRMLDDHIFRSGYNRMFLEVMREHRDDPHFCFDEATAEQDSSSLFD